MDGRVVELIEAVLVSRSGARLGRVLQDIADTAREVLAVRYAAVGVLGEDGGLDRFVHSGVDTATADRIGRVPSGHRGLLGWQSSHAQTLRLDDLSSHPASEGFPAHHPVMTSFLSAPVWVEGRRYGSLYLCDRLDGAVFESTDEELAVVLASLVGAAIASEQRQSELRRLSVIEDRERIGRDLHDLVIQRVFATGLELQGMARRLEPADPEAAGRLNAFVADLDETIRTIRSAIFSLSVDDPGSSLSERIRSLVGEELAGVLGFTPALELSGPVDDLDDTLVDEVVAVLRETLTNVAKHAGASAAEVRVALVDGWLDVSVVDDGVGLRADDSVGEGRGLRNLIHRAARLGGEVSLDGGGEGAQVVWRVPLGG